MATISQARQGPRARGRSIVAAAYGGRGRAVRNLWVVYSAKTGRDWVLPSDRHLVHWAVALEGDCSVRSFDLGESAFGAPSSGKAPDALVVRNDGTHEHHWVGGREDEVATDGPPPAPALAGPAVAAGVPAARFYSEEMLRAHAVQAVRWLKVAGFAASIRDVSHAPLESELMEAVAQRRAGVARDLLAAAAGFDEPLVVCMIGRLALTGRLQLDLKAVGFGLATPWRRPQ